LLSELLQFYKSSNQDNEYQDCYGVFIKIQDLIENFSESLTGLVTIEFRFDFFSNKFAFISVKSTKTNRITTRFNRHR